MGVHLGAPCEGLPDSPACGGLWPNTYFDRRPHEEGCMESSAAREKRTCELARLPSPDRTSPCWNPSMLRAHATRGQGAEDGICGQVCSRTIPSCRCIERIGLQVVLLVNLCIPLKALAQIVL